MLVGVIVRNAAVGKSLWAFELICAIFGRTHRVHIDWVFRSSRNRVREN